MGKPDFKYRINPASAIYVVGEFNHELLQKIVPKITELRFSNSRSIGIVINSDGGNADCLDAIISALSVLSPDGKQSRVVTSALGQAGSAGALLLALGDYAIATPSTSIHFHGIRFFSDRDVITMEGATGYASWLAAQNQRLALHLAQTMFPRVVHRAIRVKNQIKDLRDALKDPDLSLVKGYVIVATGMTSKAADNVFESAILQLERIKKLRDLIDKIKFDPKERMALKDAKVLRKVIQHELSQNKSDAWRIDESGMQQIAEDYLVLLDYCFDQRVRLHGVMELHGPDFLSKKDYSKYRKIKAKKRKSAFLAKTVYSDVSDFWYLTITIARLLLQGENKLTAEDGYWLGAIDEIQGIRTCYGERDMMER